MFVRKFKDFLLLYFSRQFLYFIFAGGLSATINFFSRIIFREQLGLIKSALIAYLIAFVCAFILYRRYVFPFSAVPIFTQGMRFSFIQLFSMPVVIFIFTLLSQLFLYIGFKAYAEIIAHAISICLPALITFLLYKFLVFKS